MFYYLLYEWLHTAFHYNLQNTSIFIHFSLFSCHLLLALLYAHHHYYHYHHYHHHHHHVYRNADDSYFVHGTLASGPSTLFVSNDLLGDYVEHLPSSQLRRIFHKWQRSCQVHLMKDNSTSLIEDRIKVCSILEQFFI